MPSQKSPRSMAELTNNPLILNFIKSHEIRNWAEKGDIASIKDSLDSRILEMGSAADKVDAQAFIKSLVHMQRNALGHEIMNYVLNTFPNATLKGSGVLNSLRNSESLRQALNYAIMENRLHGERHALANEGRALADRLAAITALGGKGK